ncbi:MAG TPA: hypothetical protein VN867_12555 [Candidatus Binataceae bacterium]|jgi:hypothetical protein|nr:hypothetical protein [Candidatus Binataceae bacterium]
MKLPHAAALALVGWCLAIPPFDYTVPVQAEAPTTRWTVRCTFDTADACAQQRQKLIDMRTKMAKPGKDRMVRIMKASRCIASDDPQLKSRKAPPDVSTDHAQPK